MAVVIPKDVERLARLMVAQKLDAVYIRHYLQETYQYDNKVIDLLFTKLGIGQRKGINPGIEAAAKKPESKIDKHSYY
jgi:hypothetical protein